MDLLGSFTMKSSEFWFLSLRSGFSRAGRFTNGLYFRFLNAGRLPLFAWFRLRLKSNFFFGDMVVLDDSEKMRCVDNCIVPFLAFFLSSVLLVSFLLSDFFLFHLLVYIRVSFLYYLSKNNNTPVKLASHHHHLNNYYKFLSLLPIKNNTQQTTCNIFLYHQEVYYFNLIRRKDQILLPPYSSLVRSYGTQSHNVII